jgi:hypothetical protein
MLRRSISYWISILLITRPIPAAAPLRITHQFSNINAQSLIGLPMGSEKTIVDKQGNLRWSHWNLKRKPLDSPFGFSSQMDGVLDIQLTGFHANSQHLYEGRYPFVVTELGAENISLEELAFAAPLGDNGFDVVRIQGTNPGPKPIVIELNLSGKNRNLPAHVSGRALLTHDGNIVVSVEGESLTFSSKENGLVLLCRWTIQPHSTQALWLKRPYESASLLPSGTELLERAKQLWQRIWSEGLRIELPQKELNDFFYSSIAYVLILSEYDANHDLWLLDGPGGYRQFWGRGEYFQARALDLTGHLDLARQSVEHAFHIQMDDGEWDGPPISGWPSWDNIGGNAGAAWDYYLFSRDTDWLAQIYPHLLAAARWIHYHREESQFEDADIPPAAKPMRRQIPWSCRPEPDPPRKPGEKPYWWGLLPWGYGDSGLPEGHAFAHNYFALYAVQCAQRAAEASGKRSDVAELAKEYEDYRDAILDDIARSVKLEKQGPPFLPAMPTYPEAAISQSFLAVYPTELFAPRDPLISGLLTRMERSERQGLPTNMAWLGPSGVWPGESMNVAETYLRRGDVEKTVDMLIAALNHSYSTNVWKEEIRVDKTLPRACTNESSHKELDNQMGTGDMPEAWANANLVNLLRDMLLREENEKLILLSGIPAKWVDPGDAITMSNAPTSLGTAMSFHFSYPTQHKMILEVSSSKRPVDILVHFPLDRQHRISGVFVNGHQMPPSTGPIVSANGIQARTDIEIEFQ